MVDTKQEERELQEFGEEVDAKTNLRALNSGVDAQRTNDPLDPMNWPIGLKVCVSELLIYSSSPSLVSISFINI